MNKPLKLKYCLLVLLMCLGVLSAHAQEPLVTVQVTKVPLKKVLNEVERQTTYRFSYRSKLLDNQPPVTVQMKNATVPAVLDKALANRNLSYRIVSAKSIVITARESQSSNIQASAAGTRTYSGVVHDAQGEPMIGATVSVGGKAVALTDADGRFSFTAPEGAKARVSFIGYVDQEVAMGHKSTVDVVMSEDDHQLNELVVVGYGAMKRKDLTGSIASVSAKDMKAYPVSNPMMGLQGRVAGVVVTNNTGNPSGDISVRIRGTNSIKGGNDPLYIVDGMPANISSISSEDIKSVEVLKDASATAIYGSRGANGVVLITTNSGQTGTHISYNGTYGVQRVISYMDVTNGEQYASLANEILTNDTGRGAFTPEQVAAFGQGFDWQDAIFQSAPMQTHNVSISSGNERTKILISGSAMLRDGIIKGTAYDKLNLRSNINHDVSDKLHVDLIMSFAKTRSTSHPGMTGGNRGNSLLSAAYFTPSILYPYNDDGTYNNISTNYTFVSSNLRNPVLLLNETDSKTRASLTNINGAITYKPFKGLSLKSSVGVENNDYRTDNYITSKYLWGANSGSVSSNSRVTIVNENIANYNVTLGEHELGVMGGFTYQQYTARSMGLSGSGFISDAPGTDQIGAASNFGTPSTGYTKWTLASWLGRVNYSYKDRYLATVSMRADGSSRYSKDSKWGYFPSVALAWRVTEEPFMKAVPQISNLKLRMGYGETGSTAINPYATLNMLSQGKQPIGNGLGTYYAAGSTLPSDLKWETTAQWNLGVDLGLFDNRLRLTADLYSKMTRDLLNSVGLAGSTGYSNTIKNIGKMSNKGLEVMVDGDIIRNNELTWSASANIAFNKNKVVKIYNGQELYSGRPGLAYMEDNISLIREGEPLGVYFTYKEDGYDENGILKYVDVDGDGNYSKEDKFITGDPHPDFTYGFSTSLAWKGFDFSVFFQGSYGNDLFNITEFQNMDYTTPMNYNKKVYYSHWSASNTPEQNAAAKYPKLTSRQNLRISDRYVEDGSYLRMKNISLGYNLPVDKLGIKRYLSSARVYVSGQNLLTITSYSGLDPEVNSWGSDINMGFDFLTYPNVKTITFGLQLIF